jgi:hypothetical protein
MISTNQTDSMEKGEIFGSPTHSNLPNPTFSSGVSSEDDIRKSESDEPISKSWHSEMKLLD